MDQHFQSLDEKTKNKINLEYELIKKKNQTAENLFGEKYVKILDVSKLNSELNKKNIRDEIFDYFEKKINALKEIKQFASQNQTRYELKNKALIDYLFCNLNKNLNCNFIKTKLDQFNNIKSDILNNFIQFTIKCCNNCDDKIDNKIDDKIDDKIDNKIDELIKNINDILDNQKFVKIYHDNIDIDSTSQNSVKAQFDSDFDIDDSISQNSVETEIELKHDNSVLNNFDFKLYGIVSIKDIPDIYCNYLNKELTRINTYLTEKNNKKTINSLNYNNLLYDDLKKINIFNQINEYYENPKTTFDNLHLELIKANNLVDYYKLILKEIYDTKTSTHDFIDYQKLILIASNNIYCNLIQSLKNKDDDFLIAKCIFNDLFRDLNYLIFRFKLLFFNEIIPVCEVIKLTLLDTHLINQNDQLECRNIIDEIILENEFFITDINQKIIIIKYCVLVIKKYIFQYIDSNRFILYDEINKDTINKIFMDIEDPILIYNINNLLKQNINEIFHIMQNHIITKTNYMFDNNILLTNTIIELDVSILQEKQIINILLECHKIKHTVYDNFYLGDEKIKNHLKKIPLTMNIIVNNFANTIKNEFFIIIKDLIKKNDEKTVYKIKFESDKMIYKIKQQLNEIIGENDKTLIKYFIIYCNLIVEFIRDLYLIDIININKDYELTYISEDIKYIASNIKNSFDIIIDHKNNRIEDIRILNKYENINVILNDLTKVEFQYGININIDLNKIINKYKSVKTIICNNNYYDYTLSKVYENYKLIVDDNSEFESLVINDFYGKIVKFITLKQNKYDEEKILDEDILLQIPLQNKINIICEIILHNYPEHTKPINKIEKYIKYNNVHDLYMDYVIYNKFKLPTKQINFIIYWFKNKLIDSQITENNYEKYVYNLIDNIDIFYGYIDGTYGIELLEKCYKIHKHLKQYINHLSETHYLIKNYDNIKTALSLFTIYRPDKINYNNEKMITDIISSKHKLLDKSGMFYDYTVNDKNIELDQNILVNKLKELLSIDENTIVLILHIIINIEYIDKKTLIDFPYIHILMICIDSYIFFNPQKIESKKYNAINDFLKKHLRNVNLTINHFDDIYDGEEKVDNIYDGKEKVDDIYDGKLLLNVYDLVNKINIDINDNKEVVYNAIFNKIKNLSINISYVKNKINFNCPELLIIYASAISYMLDNQKIKTICGTNYYNILCCKLIVNDVLAKIKYNIMMFTNDFFEKYIQEKISENNNQEIEQAQIVQKLILYFLNNNKIFDDTLLNLTIKQTFAKYYSKENIWTLSKTINFANDGSNSKQADEISNDFLLHLKNTYTDVINVITSNQPDDILLKSEKQHANEKTTKKLMRTVLISNLKIKDNMFRDNFNLYNFGNTIPDSKNLINIQLAIIFIKLKNTHLNKNLNDEQLYSFQKMTRQLNKTKKTSLNIIKTREGEIYDKVEICNTILKLIENNSSLTYRIDFYKNSDNNSLNLFFDQLNFCEKVYFDKLSEKLKLRNIHETYEKKKKNYICLKNKYESIIDKNEANNCYHSLHEYKSYFINNILNMIENMPINDIMLVIEKYVNCSNEIKFVNGNLPDTINKNIVEIIKNKITNLESKLSSDMLIKLTDELKENNLKYDNQKTTKNIVDKSVFYEYDKMMGKCANVLYNKFKNNCDNLNLDTVLHDKFSKLFFNNYCNIDKIINLCNDIFFEYYKNIRDDDIKVNKFKKTYIDFYNNITTITIHTIYKYTKNLFNDKHQDKLQDELIKIFAIYHIDLNDNSNNFVNLLLRKYDLIFDEYNIETELRNEFYHKYIQYKKINNIDNEKITAFVYNIIAKKHKKINLLKSVDILCVELSKKLIDIYFKHHRWLHIYMYLMENYKKHLIKNKKTNDFYNNFFIHNRTEIFEFLNINITDNDELIDELAKYHILIQNYVKRFDEN